MRRAKQPQKSQLASEQVIDIPTNIEEPKKRGTRVVFCIPGKTFSGKFLDCWTNLLSSINELGIDFFVLSRWEYPVIYNVRNMCLGGNPQLGKNQKPFQGQIEYDYICWIDSDILFTPKQLERLLNHNVDMVSGVYFMDGGELYACGSLEMKDGIPQLNEPDGKDVLYRLNYYSPQNIYMEREKNGLVAAGFTGFGFTLCKRKVFESLDFPWFRPYIYPFKDTEDFFSEDISTCIRLHEIGITTYIDPTVKVGHEKSHIW